MKIPGLLSLTSRFSKAECVLILITMVWGITFLLVQHALTASGPMFFVGLRFAAAAAMVALLVAFSVLATAIPLAMFSYGVQHSHYLTVSFIQYLNPLIQFCVAVLLLHEPMRAQGYAAFMVIWVAIAVYSFGAIRAYWERLKPHAR